MSRNQNNKGRGRRCYLVANWRFTQQVVRQNGLRKISFTSKRANDLTCCSLNFDRFINPSSVRHQSLSDFPPKNRTNSICFNEAYDGSTTINHIIDLWDYGSPLNKGCRENHSCTFASTHSRIVGSGRSRNSPLIGNSLTAARSLSTGRPRRVAGAINEQR